MQSGPGLLDGLKQELADAARIGVATVRLFEGEQRNCVGRRLQCLDGRLSWPTLSSSTRTVVAPDYASANASEPSPPSDRWRARAISTAVLMANARTQNSDSPRHANDASHPRSLFFCRSNRNKSSYVRKGTMKFAMMNRLGVRFPGNAVRANNLCGSSNFWTSAAISGFWRFSLVMARAGLGAISRAYNSTRHSWHSRAGGGAVHSIISGPNKISTPILCAFCILPRSLFLICSLALAVLGCLRVTRCSGCGGANA